MFHFVGQLSTMKLFNNNYGEFQNIIIFTFVKQTLGILATMPFDSLFLDIILVFTTPNSTICYFYRYTIGPVGNIQCTINYFVHCHDCAIYSVHIFTICLR